MASLLAHVGGRCDDRRLLLTFLSPCQLTSLVPGVPCILTSLSPHPGPVLCRTTCLLGAGLSPFHPP